MHSFLGTPIDCSSFCFHFSWNHRCLFLGKVEPFTKDNHSKLFVCVYFEYRLFTLLRLCASAKKESFNETCTWKFQEDYDRYQEPCN